MGVLGLWQILESVGHPIKIDALEGKRLGVDANVWLYKFIRGFREKDKGTNIDSHKLGLFNRICKLLFYKIKPVFVFDGPAPVLKRRTLERRQNVRNKQMSKIQSSAMRLIAEHLKEKYPDVDIDDVKIRLPNMVSNHLAAAEKLTDEDRDLFYLPPEDKSKPVKQEDDDSPSDDDDFEEIKSQYGRVDVNSEDFQKLPPEIRYEILKDVKDSKKRIRPCALPENASDFSNFQLQRLKARASIQQKIEQCEKDICSSYTGETTTFRIQSVPNAMMIYRSKPLTNSQSEAGSASQPSSLRSEIPTANNVGQTSQVVPESKRVVAPVVRSSSQPSSSRNDPTVANIVRQTDRVISEDDDSSSDDDEVEILSADNVGPTSQLIPDVKRVVEPVARSSSQPSSSRNDATAANIARQTDKVTSRYDDSLSDDSLPDDDDFETPTANKVCPTSQDIPESKRVVAPVARPSSQPPSSRNDVTEANIARQTDGISSEDDDSPSDDDDFVIPTANNVGPSSQVIPEVERVVAPVVRSSSQPSSSGNDPAAANFVRQTDRVISKDDDSPSDDDEVEIISADNVGPSSQVNPESKRIVEPVARSSSQPSSSRHDAAAAANIARQTNRVTSKIVDEAKELLRLFGVPYIDAAGEAEAQCALLESLNLTEGTITDDSDIWLFGAKNVYRYFFSDDKWVMQYKMPDIEFHLRMSRENLVCFAMLVGSDYTDGIMNVGPVTALEILSEFQGDSMDPLIKYKEFVDEYRAARTKIVKGDSKKRKRLLKFELHEEFPSRAVFEGYMRPVADASCEEFTWGVPDLDELREYARRNFGWDYKKIDEKLLPVMKKLSERRTQPTIDSYFFKTAANKNPELFRSKRVNAALKKISKPEPKPVPDVVCLSESDEE